MMITGRRILLIGGGGPTGPLVVNALLAQGHEVAVMNTGRHPVTFDGPVERIIADPNFLDPLRDAVQGRQFDTVIAQYGRLRYVAEAMAGHVDHFIGISSTFYPDWIDPPATVRPTAESGVARDWSAKYLDEARPMSAQVPLDPVGKFGARVVETDRALQWAHAHGVFEATILRYPRVYGPRQPGATEWSVIRRVLDGRPRILLPEGGFLMNSALYSENAARIVLGAVANRSAASGQTFNCADGETITQRKWVRLIAQALGKDIAIASVPAALAQPAWPYARWPLTIGHHLLDTGNLAQLGYQPTPVQTAIQRTVAWFVEDLTARGAAAEPQLRDVFRYDLEDRLLAALDHAQAQIEAIEFPEFDMSHYYAHPSAPTPAATR